MNIGVGHAALCPTYGSIIKFSKTLKVSICSACFWLGFVSFITKMWILPKFFIANEYWCWARCALPNLRFYYKINEDLGGEHLLCSFMAPICILHYENVDIAEVLHCK